MSWKLSNFAGSTLSQAIAAADLTVYIDADDVDFLPTLGVGDKAKAVIFNSAYREIVNITAWNTNGTLTVERAQETTTALDWAAGTRLIHTPTAEVLQAVLDATIQAVYRGTATGTNAITVTGSGSVPTPSDGDAISFEVAVDNTAAVTLSYTNGSTTIGPFDLVSQSGTALIAGDLDAGFRVTAVYDSSLGDFVLASQGSRNYLIDKINTGPLDSNLLPNGAFDAWGAGTSFATPASGTETADNVIVTYDGTIGAFTASQQTFTLGQTDVPGGPKYFYRWNQSSAGAASSFRKIRMKLKNVGKYELEKLIAAMYLKADIARNVTATLIQSFGTGGAPSAEVTVATEVWALGTSWAQFDLPGIPASIAGKTLGSGADDGLILELSLPVNTSMTIDCAMGQIEFGTIATKPHSRLPWTTEQGGTGGSYATQLLLATALSVLSGTWLTQTSFNTNNPDLAAIEALGSTGFSARTASNTWAQRSFTSSAGLTITNPAGVAGNPDFALSTGLINYSADPLSVGELASITGNFGTAAFVADSGLVHIAGAETITGAKVFSAALVGTSTILSRTAFAAIGVLSDAGAAGRGIRFSCTGATSDSVSLQGTVDSFSTVVTIATMTPSTGAVAWGVRPSFNGNTALDFGNGAQLGAVNLFTARQQFGASVPFNFYNSGGGVNETLWDFSYTSSTLVFGALNDAYSTRNNIYTITRSAATPLVFEFDIVDVRLEMSRTNTEVNSAGYLGSPVINGNVAYAFPREDSGKTIYHDEAGTRTYTIPANSSVPHPIGTIFVIDNTGNSGAAGAITLAITTDTLRRGDGTAGTGSRTIPASAVVQIRKVSSTVWIITGVFT